MLKRRGAAPQDPRCDRCEKVFPIAHGNPTRKILGRLLTTIYILHLLLFYFIGAATHAKVSIVESIPRNISAGDLVLSIHMYVHKYIHMYIYGIVNVNT